LLESGSTSGGWEFGILQGALDFASPDHIAVGSAPNFIAVADFNADGKPDFAATNAGESSISVSLNRVTPGSTTATFTTPRTLSGGSGPNFIAVPDRNGDGRPDIAVANTGSNSISVRINTTAEGSLTPSFGSELQLVIANGPTF